MATFNEANQAKLSLKMKLCNYYWYDGSVVMSDGDDYSIVVHSSKMDNTVRKIVPFVHEGVSVKVEVNSRK